jgi:hypothetical protein
MMWAFASINPIVWGSVLVSTFLGNVSVKPAKGGKHEVVEVCDEEKAGSGSLGSGTGALGSR